MPSFPLLLLSVRENTCSIVLFLAIPDNRQAEMCARVYANVHSVSVFMLEPFSNAS